jgi:hypothetical protein
MLRNPKTPIFAVPSPRLGSISRERIRADRCV